MRMCSADWNGQSRPKDASDVSLKRMNRREDENKDRQTHLMMKATLIHPEDRFYSLHFPRERQYFNATIPCLGDGEDIKFRLLLWQSRKTKNDGSSGLGHGLHTSIEEKVRRHSEWTQRRVNLGTKIRVFARKAHSENGNACDVSFSWTRAKKPETKEKYKETHFFLLLKDAQL